MRQTLTLLVCLVALTGLSSCAVDGSLYCGRPCDPDGSIRARLFPTVTSTADGSADGAAAASDAAQSDDATVSSSGPPSDAAPLADGPAATDASPGGLSDGAPEGGDAGCSTCGGISCCFPQTCVGTTCCNGVGGSCSGGCCAGLVCSAAGECVRSCKNSGSCSVGGQNDCCRSASYCDVNLNCVACLPPNAACVSDAQCCNGRCLNTGLCSVDT